MKARDSVHHNWFSLVYTAPRRALSSDSVGANGKHQVGVAGEGRACCRFCAAALQPAKAWKVSERVGEQQSHGPAHLTVLSGKKGCSMLSKQGMQLQSCTHSWQAKQQVNDAAKVNWRVLPLEQGG